MEDVAPTGVRQAFSELPLPSHVLPEPGFPDTDPSQVGAWAGGLWAVAWHPCHTRHMRLGLRPHGSWAELPAVSRKARCSAGVSFPGLQPRPATCPSPALKHPTLRAGQPAHGPVHPAGEPAASGLWDSTDPGPSAHCPDPSLRASQSSHCSQQLRREDPGSQAGCRENQEGGGESCLLPLSPRSCLILKLKLSGLNLGVEASPCASGTGRVSRTAVPLARGTPGPLPGHVTHLSPSST